MISKDGPTILAKVIEQAKAGDGQAQAAFLKLLPRYRFTSSPIDLVGLPVSVASRRSGRR